MLLVGDVIPVGLLYMKEDLKIDDLAQWMAHLLHICEILRSDFGLVTVYPY
jgi:hypothetical protein